MHVIVADDHELARSGLMLMLRDEFPEARLSEAATLDEALNYAATDLPADLVLVDRHMPGMESEADIAELCAVFAGAKIVIVSGDEQREEVFAALTVGARGYIFKSQRESEMKAALAQILAGGIYVPATIGFRPPEVKKAQVALQPLPSSLSDRQKTVLSELLDGKSSKEIAQSLEIAEATVRVHISVIYRVLGIHSRAEALARFR